MRRPRTKIDRVVSRSELASRITVKATTVPAGKVVGPAATESVGSGGRIPSYAAQYSVTTDLPDEPPITEAELRAVEILLGGDLKTLLANIDIESLKSNEFKR